MLYTIYLEVLFRPFLNALVLIYNFMPGYKDMGIALVIFVVILRILLLPLRKKAKASEPDQEKLMKEIEEIEEKYKYEPIQLKIVKKRLFKKHKGTVNLRLFDLIIQAVYFGMLWKIFGGGFTEHELSLLYSFVSKPSQPMNLTFLHLFDLTKPNPTLNFISAVGLFIVLVFANWAKSKKATREDYILIIWAPVAAFFITYRIPAGQEFFFTVTETVEFLLILNDQMAKWRKKIGMEAPIIDSKAIIKTAREQILGG